MEKTKKSYLLVILFSLFFSATAAAQDTPNWVSKGTKSINAQRSNDSYTVESFNTYDFQLDVLENTATNVLKDYVRENYGAVPQTINVLLLSNGPQPVYEVTYQNINGENCSVIAKRIDVYTDFDDFELNVYQFEYHQLYAISRPNVTPMFDEFEFTKSYKGLTTTMSLVPGMAQLYKGQDTKGYVIIGSEVFFAASTLVFDYKRRLSRDEKHNQPAFEGSWASKERAWRTFEIGALACFAGVYIYNVIDGITSNGAKQVVVKKAKRPQFTFTPYAATDQAGMTFKLSF